MILDADKKIISAAVAGIDTAGHAHEVEELEERLNIIRHKLKFIEKKPAVFCLQWLNPFTVAGGWVPQLVEIAGGTALFAETDETSAQIEWANIAAAGPEVIILMLSGCSIEHAMKEINTLFNEPDFAGLAAIKNNRLYVADGSRYFNYPGPQLVDSVEILAEIIHPKQFIFGYEGQGWVKFDV